ncbi:MAG: hypothetical protein ACRDKL_06820 [Solirubrobacteraceae bacterium]
MEFGLVHPLLVFGALLGAGVWLGGMVTIVVVAQVARGQLERPALVGFFQALGRRYLPIGGAALALALAAGGGLLSARRWDGTALAAVLTAAALVTTLVIGVAQARRMTRLRTLLLASPADLALARRVQRGVRSAIALRAAIAVLSLGLLALGAVLA